MPSFDPEVLGARLERIAREVDAIDASLPPTPEEYGDAAHEGLRYELEHRLLIALQAVMDIAAHVAVAAGSRPIETYRDAVLALAAQGIVPGDLAEALAEAVGLRNALVHEYLGIDDARVWAALSRTDDLKRFSVAVWRWMESWS